MTTMQLSFGDAEHTGKRKKTRREVFLAEMEQVVPWNALLALIAPHYPGVSDFLCVRRFSPEVSFSEPA